MSKRLSRNAPCPCGSGKKYKQCCIGKDFEWIETDDGRIARSVPVSEELREILDRQAEYQIAKYGKLQDKIFADAPPLELIEHWTVESMRKGGVEPALIYAYEKTNGLLLNAHNERKVPDSDIAEWEAAIDEYESKTGKKAARRRLSDDDFNGMMQNAPKERSPRDMVTRLAYRPPFEKEEWQKWKMSDILEEPDCAEYFQRCMSAVVESGRSQMYLNVFLLMTTIPDDEPCETDEDYQAALEAARNRDFTADELEQALELVAESCGPKGAISNCAAAFEFLSFVGDFINAFAEHKGIKEQLEQTLVKVHGLAMLAFVGAVNAEFGFQTDIWKE